MLTLKSKKDPQLTTYYNLRRQRKKNKFKTGSSKEIINIRAEVNKRKNRKKKKNLWKRSMKLKVI